MSVRWVIENMKRIWEEQCVSIGNYIFFLEVMCKFTKPCDVTIQPVP